MPTFDFQCAKCKNVFEFSRPFGSDEQPKCPTCGSKRTEKMITPPPVVFKGSGWYKTDSRARATEGTKGTEETKAVSKEKKVKEVKKESKGSA